MPQTAVVRSVQVAMFVRQSPPQTWHYVLQTWHYVRPQGAAPPGQTLARCGSSEGGARVRQAAVTSGDDRGRGRDGSCRVRVSCQCQRGGYLGRAPWPSHRSEAKEPLATFARTASRIAWRHLTGTGNDCGGCSWRESSKRSPACQVDGRLDRAARPHRGVAASGSSLVAGVSGEAARAGFRWCGV
jgi:hypothetical protein